MQPTPETSAALGGIGIVFFACYAVLFVICLVCFIKVLVALFKKEGAGLGILGLFCSIYAYIWGWMKSTELGLKKTMIWWTIGIGGFFVIALVGSVAAAGAMAKDPSFKKAMEDAQRDAAARQEQQAEQQQ